MEISVAILALGGLIFLAHLLSALFERTRIPDVLPLVLLGVLLGPVLGLVKTDDFGKVGGIFTSVALVGILFDSGLGLDLASLKQSMTRGIWLTVVNFSVSLVLGMGLAHFAFGFSMQAALLLGAILGGTSSAVVIPLIEKIRLGDSCRTALLLESTFSDVLCIVGTLGLLKAFQSESVQAAALIGNILASFLLSALLGSAGALLWSTLLHQVRKLENGTLTTPAFVFILYGLTEMMGYSGGIAALAFGIVLGNIRRFGVPLPVLRAFKDFEPVQLNPSERTVYSEMVFLLKTFFFVYIGLNIQTKSLGAAMLGLALTALFFAARILVVRISLSRTLSRFDASVAAIMVPKGLAAAVLAAMPLQAGMPEGGRIQEIVFAVILFSITATAILAFLMEKSPLGSWYAGIYASFGAMEALPSAPGPKGPEPAP